MTADEWIEAFARELGVEAPSEQQTADLLALAATAAHASERVAAPIACFIAGRTGRPLADLRAAAERVGGD
jgi:hypothetical protein